MKCKTCGKEVNQWSPKQYCNIDCEKKKPKDPEVENLKKIFWMT